MEVIVPFNMGSSAVSPPYMSAPSSPQRFYSPITSPARASAFSNNYEGFYAANSGGDSSSAIPFIWEEKPGIAKEDGDFEFDFGMNLQRNSVSADELFDGGKIKPLKPPPGFQLNQNKPIESPKSPRSPRKLIVEAFSPRRKVRDFDPFAEALELSRKLEIPETRGNSLSPIRVNDHFQEPDSSNQETTNSSSSSSSSSALSSSSSSISSSKWCQKWKIKNLFLFMNSSHRDNLKKMNHNSPDCRRSSCPPISAHEFHYSVRHSLSKEMEKRSLLQYKQGLLGCLGFQQTAMESSAKLH